MLEHRCTHLNNRGRSRPLPPLLQVIALLGLIAGHVVVDANPGLEHHSKSSLCALQVLALLELPVLVVLDEAYIEFSSEPSKLKWVQKYPNLVVLRTFSKSAALAGLRIGYGSFPLDMVGQGHG